MKHLLSYFSCIIVFVFWSTLVLAQQDPVDVLSFELKNAKSDTAKLRLLVALSEESEVNRMLEYAEPAATLADKLLNTSPSPEGTYKSWLLNKKSLAINNIGFVYYNSGDLVKALDYWEKSLKLSEETGDKESIGTLYNNIASVFDVQGDIAKALDYYAKSLKLQEELKNDQGIANALNNIGTVYDKQNDKEKAFEYYNRCVALYQSAGDKFGYASALNNIGNLYNK